MQPYGCTVAVLQCCCRLKLFDDFLATDAQNSAAHLVAIVRYYTSAVMPGFTAFVHHFAEGFASTITAFCERLGYWEIHAAIRSFAKRVVKSRTGGQPGQGQLAGLKDIKGLQGSKARVLFEHRVQTAEQVAVAEVDW